nr:3-oxoacyl-[acyl-carrier-protein] synthase III C-terminal domain-containing protein [Brevibacillus dissolubilis]
MQKRRGTMPAIASVGVVTPPHQVSQNTARDFVQNLFQQDFRDIERLMPIFASSQIDTRYFCQPIEWFAESHSWEEKNSLYIRHAITMSKQAIQNCLQKAGLTPQDIDHLVYVSTTGISTPSIDAHLINELGMKSNVKRTPIFGLGCAGGVAGLARGYDLAKAHPHERVLICCVELCGLTFMQQDRSKSNLIATGLFADGAAAVLVTGDEVPTAQNQEPQGQPTIIATRSTLFPDTMDVMGWDIRDDGLKVIFSKDIPTLIGTMIQPEIHRFLADQGLCASELSSVIAHPGGMKVLMAYEESLGLPSEMLTHAREVLRTRGNMSSCTVLYVMEKELTGAAHREGDYGLVLSLGPGFSCEQVLIRW